MTRPVVIIGGPTASGKSSLAVALARHFDGTVINADSLQIYRDLGILTAQPSADDLAQAPHDLYAFADANDRYDAMRWRDAAVQAITRSHAQNRLPVIVGGTGFYINALLEGMSPIPPIEAHHRTQAQDFFDTHGLAALAAEISKIDPALATHVDSANPQRLMRAYEVFHATGKPLSYWQSQPKSGAPAGMRFLTIVIDPPREELHRNAALRIAIMEKAGMGAQVATFKQRIASGEVAPDAALTHACGYHPLADFMDGRCTREQALEAMLIDTRQYAKRQSTWFKNQITPNARLASAKDDTIASVLDAWLRKQN